MIRTLPCPTRNVHFTGIGWYSTAFVQGQLQTARPPIARGAGKPAALLATRDAIGPKSGNMVLAVPYADKYPADDPARIFHQGSGAEVGAGETVWIVREIMAVAMIRGGFAKM
jgi:hypothetical protein